MNFPVPSPNYYQPQPVYFQRNISIQETRLTNPVYQPKPEMMPSNNIPQYQHPYQQMSSPTPEPINTTNPATQNCYVIGPHHQPIMSQYPPNCPPQQIVMSPPPPQYSSDVTNSMNYQVQTPTNPVLPTSSPSSDIPDVRHQFLSSQFACQPGQVVMLPPLSEDRTVQTIQILTPVPGTSPVHHTVQTIVLPIIVPEVKSENIIQDEEMFLNKIDGTGLPQVMQGIDLDQVKQFAAEFKTARISLGLTQAQVGQALNKVWTEDQISVSQSSICRFEKLEITALQVKKLLPALQTWLAWAKQRQSEGLPVLVHEELDFKEIKKRKRRTVFNQETVAALVEEFDQNNTPNSLQLSVIAERLGLDKETTRVWFCNKRQQIRKSVD